jgi:hypothetical protein
MSGIGEGRAGCVPKYGWGEVNAKELVDLVRRDDTVVPFLGAGMALRAGAPNVWELAARLSDIAVVSDGELGAVVRAAEASIGLEDTRRAVAEIVGGRPLRADSRLMKLVQWPAQRILTTNYDDAVELAAREAGFKTRTVIVGDSDALTMEPGVVKVIHLHGHHSEPSSIVLPGPTTDRLASEEVFLNQVRAMMQQGTILYLGFSFGTSEIHLRGIVSWLRQIRNARRHLLVLPEGDLVGREADLVELSSVPQVTVAGYPAPHRDHTFIEALSSVHARLSFADGRHAEIISSPKPPAYIDPALVKEEEGEDLEDLQGKVIGAEGGWGEPFAVLKDLAAAGPVVLSGQPGMGKTEALRRLARTYEHGEALVVSATDLAQALRGHGPDEHRLNALSKAIALGLAGRDGVVRPDYDALARNSYLLLLDDFDQVGVDEREAVAAAVLLADERWPQHRWIVAGRPCLELANFSNVGFVRYRILPSESWGHAYLRKRGVAEPAIDRVTNQQAGFGAVMGIPLFAATAADRLLGEGPSFETPLGLLVDAQRETAGKEARRHGRSESEWWIWLRRLAVGLEVRSQTEASTAELATVPGRGGFDSEKLREELVRASLLIELPDRAAFPRRTLQEALCAHAVLSTEDAPESVSRVAVAEVAGELHLRSDMEFTLDLVFESASRESRDRLREIDQQRWALTVIARGTMADAEEALDLLIEDAERRGHSVSMFAAGLRSPLQAVRLIARSWPELVSARRERLLQAIGAAEAHSRFNALWVLAAQESDEDPSWLPPMIEDEERRVAQLAAETAAAWGVRDALPHLEAVIARRGPVHERKRLLRVAFRLAESQEEAVRIVASLLNDGQLIGESASEIATVLDLDGYLELLGRRTHDSRISEWLLDGALQIAGAGDWTDERVEKMVEAVVTHDGDPQIASDVRLVSVVGSHLEPALAAARRELYHRPPVFRGLAMFATVPVEKLAGEENAAIVEGAKRALDPEEVARWGRNPAPQDRWGTALARLEDPAADPADVLEPGMHWRVGEMSEDQRDRLGELASANLPPVNRAIDGERFGWSRTDELRLGALNAAAQLDFPMELGRWMQILRSPEVLDTVQALFDWLRRRYDPGCDSTIEAYVAEAGDCRVLSIVIVVLPPTATALRESIARRLDEITIDDGWWSNAVGLLAEGDGPELLHRLRRGPRTPMQLEVLRSRLAKSGDASAQVESLTAMVETARGGEMIGEPPHWTEPVEDRSVLDALGELMDALGCERRGSGWWDFALGKIAGSPDPHALGVLDRVVDATGVALDFARLTLARRLAAAIVLTRLPADIVSASMVFEEGAVDERDAVPP